jgi:hypothetical protein
MKKENGYDLIRGHIDQFWPSTKKTEFSWKSSPISKNLPNFSVCQIEPNSPDGEWVYITIGLSDVHSPNNEHIELFILSPNKDATHTDTLAMVANFHADPKYGVYLGKTVNIGRPWMRKATCDYFLVSLPYSVEPKFEWLRIENTATRFLWLLPITSAEARYADKFGLDALEKKFEEQGIEYLNPIRPSAV